MADMHVVNPLPRKARRDLLPLLLQVQYYRQETVDVCWRYIVAVRTLDEGLALQVEDCDQAGHRANKSGCCSLQSSSFPRMNRPIFLKYHKAERTRKQALR